MFDVVILSVSSVEIHRLLILAVPENLYGCISVLLAHCQDMNLLIVFVVD